MFKNAREIAELFGFKIRIDPSWFVIAGLIVWSLSTAYFPQYLPNAAPLVIVMISVLAMLGLFISLILHELAHSLVARHFNLNVGSITLFIFGGVAELEHDPESAESEFWIAIAGPAMSFLLGGAFLAVAAAFPETSQNTMVPVTLNYLGFINLVLAIFNLVPAFPLDGGRILRAIIWRATKDVLKATRIACTTGKIFGFLLIGIGALSLFSTQIAAGIWQILIGMFILVASRSTYNDLVVRKTLKDYTVSSLMTRNPWVANVDETLQCIVDNIMLKRNVSFVPVLDDEKLLGYVDTAIIQTIDRENWDNTKVGDIFVSTCPENTTRAEARTEDVFDKMAATGNRKLLVVTDDRLEGIVTLADLMTFLSIRDRLGLSPVRPESEKKHPYAHA